MKNKVHYVDSRKVAVIGCGFVGSTIAFALMQSGLFSDMVLIEVDMKKAEGEALDIGHGISFARPGPTRSRERQGWTWCIKISAF